MNSEPFLANLFNQLGLDNTQNDIDEFINTHQLSAHELLCDAVFWNSSQQEFLERYLLQDGDWVSLIDCLNQKLHSDVHC